MKPFRKNVAIAIDGGGIRGVIVTKALSMLEQELNQPLHDIFRLTAGTSTPDEVIEEVQRKLELIGGGQSR